MPSKSTRGTSSATAAIGGELRVEVDRLIEKERFKDAVKQAKLCYKQENTPENHKLLECAYFLRARQLVQLGMAASAVEVAQQLLDFGLTASDWADEFIRLLMSLSLKTRAFEVQDRFGSPEKKDILHVMAADDAVIQLATDVLGTPPDQSILEELADADGNPFLVVETLLGLQEENRIRLVAGHAGYDRPSSDEQHDNSESPKSIP